MEDRQAPRFRPLSQGIPAQPLGGIPLDGGIPMDVGIPIGPQSVHGVPTGPIITKEMRREDDEPMHCIALTRKGTDCKAWAVKDQPFCVGHKK